MLAVFLFVAHGCMVKQGAGQDPQSSGNRLLLDALPTDAEGLAAVDLTPDLVRGWKVLRAGRFAMAEEIFARAVDGASMPAGAGRAAALSGLGFSRLGLSRHREAGEAFERALETQPHYGPALLGQALRLRLLGRAEESVALYEILSAQYPNSATIRIEAQAAGLEAVQQLVRSGDALADRDPEAAALLYRQAIDIDPDLPRLYGLLAAALESSGEYKEALQALEQALSLSRGEEAEAIRERLAWLELEQGSPQRAVSLFQTLLQSETGDPAHFLEGLRQAEEKLRQAKIPAEYRQLLSGAIPLDRGGLAAIISLEYGWGEGPGPTGGVRPLVIRDAASHWSQPYVRGVVDRGVMDLYQNHTFRPSTPVSRGDLAFAACRLLDRCGGAGAEGEEPVAIGDLNSDHRHYHCVCRLVSLGLLLRFPDTTVRINTPATGTDALELVSAMHQRFGEPEP